MGLGRAYIVLGAGHQGVAAAYDIARYGHATRVTLADASLPLARSAVEKVKALLGVELTRNGTTLAARRVDGRRSTDLVKAIDGHCGVLSALPYFLNPTAARAAIVARAHYVDLGGHFDTTQEILKLDRTAQKAAVTLTPDCGVAPGLCNALATRGMSRLDKTDEIRMYCGGLPQKPHPPLGYKLVFNMEGVLGNYFGNAYEIKHGRVALGPSFGGKEELDFGPPLGRLEAFVTGGATSTCPWTFEGRVQTLTYKTLRYPGHHEKIETLRGLGLFESDPIRLDSQWVSPRRLFIKLAEERLRFPGEKDLLVMRVKVRGEKDGVAKQVVYDMLEYEDPSTGFTAMQRTTGFTAAIVLEMLVLKEVEKPGVVPLEKLISPKTYLDAVRQRGFAITETIS
jgi:lysine 6-dehydrogenase